MIKHAWIIFCYASSLSLCGQSAWIFPMNFMGGARNRYPAIPEIGNRGEMRDV